MGWVVIYMYLASSGDASKDSDNNNHIKFDQSTSYNQMWWYHIFGLLWGVQFVLACQEITLAGCYATWYFTHDKEAMKSPVRQSMWRVFRYHLGSAALGSLIIAIIELMRLVLEYIDRKTKGTQSKIAQFVIKCLRCCLWCLERFMKFINKNAYIEIAVYGYSFCTAARQAFKVLLANVLRLAAINTV